MQPYYEEPGITIYHGDCRDILPSLEAVDLLLTDPPYGLGMKAFTDDFDICRVLNKVDAGIAAIFMSPRRIKELFMILDTWIFERLLWMHKTADIAFPWRGWCMNSEAIAIFSRHQASWPSVTHARSDVYQVGPWERSGHPNGKPLGVVTDLLSRLSNGSVIDPFMGSGTVLRSAKDLGRQAIGIEIKERYCEIAVNRLRQGVLDLAG